MQRERKITWQPGKSYEDLWKDIDLGYALYSDTTTEIIKLFRSDDEHYFKAVELIRSFIERKLPILISGDADSDGLVATTVMYKSLKDLGANVVWWVPDRLTDGYGINVDVVREKLAVPGLVLTVDAGITETEKIQKLREIGYYVLVTDHHIPDREDLPQDCVLLDPKLWAQPDSLDYLASGGLVAAKLAFKVRETYGITELDPFVMELVALCILSDVIELSPQMQLVLRYGLSCLQTTENTGLQALFKVCGLKPEAPLTTHILNFNVIPKLNAAGRMGQSNLGVELLLATLERDHLPIGRETYLAQTLLDLNSTRKEVEAAIYEEALEQAEKYCRRNENTLVVYKPGWHPGVLGIVAARLMEKYYRPTIVLTKVQDLIKGSARSIEGFDIYNVLKQCDSLLEFGGHAVAAGLTLEEDLLTEFKKQFETTVAKIGLPTERILEYSRTVTLEDLQNIPWLMNLEAKEPTGNKNPDWLFKTEPVKLKFVGMRGQAASLLVENRNKQQMVLKQFRPSQSFDVYIMKTIEALISPTFIYFGGTTNVEWRVVDFHTYNPGIYAEH